MRSVLLILTVLWPLQAGAFCDPPIAPAPTSLETAKEFRAEFQQEFEQYFRDAEKYLRCLDQERSDVLGEIRQTVVRYQRFLHDSEAWE